MEHYCFSFHDIRYNRLQELSGLNITLLLIYTYYTELSFLCTIKTFNVSAYPINIRTLLR